MFGAEGVNLADDWNPVGWATAGGIAVIGLGAAGYEYFQDSRPLSSFSAAAPG